MAVETLQVGVSPMPHVEERSRAGTGDTCGSQLVRLAMETAPGEWSSRAKTTWKSKQVSETIPYWMF